LSAIDRYLIFAHRREQSVANSCYVNTVSAVAMYVGEVLRRQQDALGYQWVASNGERIGPQTTIVAAAELGVEWMLVSASGRAVRPHRIVERVLRRGTGVPTDCDSVIGAIGSTNGNTTTGERAS
jgi:hypothetical protein